MKNKLLLLLFLLLVLVTPFCKAEEEVSLFKIPDSEIDGLFEEEHKVPITGVPHHTFILTCKKSALDLMILKGKNKIHDHPASHNRTINISIPSLTLEVGEKTELILRFPPSLLGHYKEAKFNSEAFDAENSSDKPLSYTMPIFVDPDINPLFTLHAAGEVIIPFFIADQYEFVYDSFSFADKYTLRINVVFSITPTITTESPAIPEKTPE